MATTFSPKILKHQIKSNGTYPVVYRLTHNRISRYIKTRHYVDDSQITGKDDIHIDFIIDHLSDDLKKYRKKIAEIENIDLMTVDEVKDIVIGKKTHIDFKAFVRLHIERLKVEGRNGTAKPFVTVLNSLNDYVIGELPTFMITSKFLEKYEIYLRTPKKVKRKQGSVLAERNAQLNDKGLNNHMAAFRTLFNAAREYYNDEDTGKILIKNNPFSKYRIKPKKGKEHKNLSIDIIRKIRDFEPETRLENVGFKMFMLSFYLCGMNSVDIFKNWEKLKKFPC